MNYRHAFHAGNFADLVKHAALLAMLARRGDGPLAIVDTHAGAGLYDLDGEAAARSGEAAAGIVRLMSEDQVPAPLEVLRAAVRRANPKGGLRWYPGSPLLAARALASGDSYLGFELRADDHAALTRALQGQAGATTVCADGFEAAAKRIPANGEALVLIDPPFERPDDYRRIVETTQKVRLRNPAARLAIWLPLKDLETFDALLRDLEPAAGEGVLVCEARMRPLSDPLKMNGCALVIVRPPDGLADDLEAVCTWTVEALGENGQAKVWTLN